MQSKPQPDSLKAPLDSLARIITEALKRMGQGVSRIVLHPLPSGVLRISIVFEDREESFAWSGDGRLVLSSADNESPNERSRAAMLAVVAALKMISTNSRFAMLNIFNRKLDVFHCDDRAMDRILSRRFTIGETVLEDFVFASANERSGARYELFFDALSGDRLVFILSPPKSSDWKTCSAGPFDLRVELTRNNDEALRLMDLEALGSLGESMERAVTRVAFMLNRSLHSEMRLDTSQSGPPDIEVEDGEESEHYKPEGVSDFKPDTNWRRFFTPFDVERDAICDFRFVDTTTFVQHGELECCYIQPIAPVAQRFHKPLWKIDKSIGSNNKGYCTFLDDADLITGENDKLDRLLAELRAAGSVERMVFLNETCVSKIVGEDIRRSRLRHERREGSPVIALDIGLPGPGDILADVVEQLKTVALADDGKGRDVVTGSVAFVGYPADASIRELQGILERFGIEKQTYLLPQLGIDLLWRTVCSEVVVSTPSKAWNDIARRLIDDGRPIHTPTLPYGYSSTMAWAACVLEALGKDKRIEEMERIAEKERSLYENEYLGQTKDCGLAIVGDASDMSRLLDPALYFGVPLVSFLLELGFGLTVFQYDGRSSKGEESGQKLIDLYGDRRLRILPFDSKEELQDMLEREDGIQSVYSQFSFDRRLYACGKSSFSLLDLEKGFEGAMRTARRLTKRCGWCGPKIFGAHVQSRGWK